MRGGGAGREFRYIEVSGGKRKSRGQSAAEVGEPFPFPFQCCYCNLVSQVGLLELSKQVSKSASQQAPGGKSVRGPGEREGRHLARGRRTGKQTKGGCAPARIKRPGVYRNRNRIDSATAAPRMHSCCGGSGRVSFAGRGIVCRWSNQVIKRRGAAPHRGCRVCEWRHQRGEIFLGCDGLVWFARNRCVATCPERT